jgi:hypothetical protein
VFRKSRSDLPNTAVVIRKTASDLPRTGFFTTDTAPMFADIETMLVGALAITFLFAEFAIEAPVKDRERTVLP